MREIVGEIAARSARLGVPHLEPQARRHDARLLRRLAHHRHRAARRGGLRRQRGVSAGRAGEAQGRRGVGKPRGNGRMRSMARWRERGPTRRSLPAKGSTPPLWVERALGRL